MQLAKSPQDADLKHSSCLSATLTVCLWYLQARLCSDGFAAHVLPFSRIFLCCLPQVCLSHESVDAGNEMFTVEIQFFRRSGELESRDLTRVGLMSPVLGLWMSLTQIHARLHLSSNFNGLHWESSRLRQRHASRVKQVVEVRQGIMT